MFSKYLVSFESSNFLTLTTNTFSLKQQAHFVHFWENVFPNTKIWLIQVLLSFIQVKMIPKKKAASQLTTQLHKDLPWGQAPFFSVLRCFMIPPILSQSITKMHTQLARRNKINHFYSFIKDNLKWNGLFFNTASAQQWKNTVRGQQFYLPFVFAHSL